MKYLHMKCLPFEFRYFLRRLFNGKYYSRYIPFYRNKQSEITHEFCIMLKEPTQWSFGICLDFKQITFRIEFLWFRVAIEAYEDLPF
jgi:hypothetical protein